MTWRHPQVPSWWQCLIFVMIVMSEVGLMPTQSTKKSALTGGCGRILSLFNQSCQDKQQAVYHSPKNHPIICHRASFMLLVLPSHPPMMACVIFRLEHLVRLVARFFWWCHWLWRTRSYSRCPKKLGQKKKKTHIRYSGSPNCDGIWGKVDAINKCWLLITTQ